MNLSPTPSKPSPCPKGSKTFQPTGKGGLWVQWNIGGPAWAKTLEQVKRLPSKDRKYLPDLKCWEARDTADIRQLLLGYGFQLVGGTQASGPIGMPSAPTKREIAPWIPPWKDVEVPTVPMPLRPYQIEGLQMLQYRNGRGGLFLDMGLGKSLNALAWLYINPSMDRVVILSTASTKTQWGREARKWGIQLPFYPLSGRTPSTLPRRGAVVLNWDILEAWTDALIDWNPQTIIADEVQAVGNPQAKRTKAFARLAEDRGLLALSGTPALTRPSQLFTILHALEPEVFPKLWNFQQRYCDPRQGAYGVTFNGSTNAEELHEKIRPLGIRHTKFDVLKDLPDRIYTPVLMDCQVSDEYQEAQDKILALQGVSAKELREKLTALTASAFEEKKDAVLAWIGEFLETGEKLVLFAWHTAVLDFLAAHFGKACVRVSGGVSRGDRESAVSRFVKDPTCRVFLGQTAAAGVGIDGLQEVCSNVAFVELCWSPALVEQAESRLHRMGQKASVNVWYLLAPGTVDTMMLEALEQRKNSLATVMDGQTEFDEDESVLNAVRKLTKEKP